MPSIDCKINIQFLLTYEKKDFTLWRKDLCRGTFLVESERDRGEEDVGWRRCMDLVEDGTSMMDRAGDGLSYSWIGTCLRGIWVTAGDLEGSMPLRLI